jgi:hypothetical protein
MDCIQNMIPSVTETGKWRTHALHVHEFWRLWATENLIRKHYLKWHSSDWCGSTAACTQSRHVYVSKWLGKLSSQLSSYQSSAILQCEGTGLSIMNYIVCQEINMSNIFLTGCKNSSSYIDTYLCCFYTKLFHVPKPKMINGKKKRKMSQNGEF